MSSLLQFMILYVKNVESGLWKNIVLHCVRSSSTKYFLCYSQIKIESPYFDNLSKLRFIFKNNTCVLIQVVEKLHKLEI